MPNFCNNLSETSWFMESSSAIKICASSKGVVKALLFMAVGNISIGCFVLDSLSAIGSSNEKEKVEPSPS